MSNLGEKLVQSSGPPIAIAVDAHFRQSQGSSPTSSIPRPRLDLDLLEITSRYFSHHLYPTTNTKVTSKTTPKTSRQIQTGNADSFNSRKFIPKIPVTKDNGTYTAASQVSISARRLSRRAMEAMRRFREFVRNVVGCASQSFEGSLVHAELRKIVLCEFFVVVCQSRRSMAKRLLGFCADKI
jgi:hypothetical protein